MSAANVISLKDCDHIVKVLSTVFADTYALYLKTQNFHWNVTGPLFPMLHKFFEQQYEELADAVDELAERIRSLGHFAPASFSAFAKLSSLKEENGHPDAKQMVNQLLADHETVIHALRKAIHIAGETGDEATADLLIKRLDEHENTAWMLRSTIQ